ncbi:mediator of RNA polymerase II transcription subunit 15a-like [Ipomoea triloba]|uniref:mediator of RNA polymerase II transcription subunit 15a-like n=1 Tax=Ipomoea triloba TaxID=35885 RepID=UPI00125D84C4|nr:mediator of RNA polymerase II transcription subunit 15a-like [Ipomoea triloba]
MDGNNWRAAQPLAQPQGVDPAAIAAAAAAAPVPGAMETGDWRTQLQPESRQRIVNKIMETLKRHLSLELKKIEEKIYTAATNQSDYLRKMLSMETKSQNSIANLLQANVANSSQNPQMQPQGNQSQARQQLLSQNITCLDSTGNANVGDWQEEAYQKIKAMKETYYMDLNELFQKIAGKLGQLDSVPQQPKNEQIEKLKMLKVMVERLLHMLRLNKNDIQPQHKDKMGYIEKQIIYLLNSNRRTRKPASSLQQMQPPQNHDLQMQSVNVQGTMAAIMHHNSVSSVSPQLKPSISSPQVHHTLSPQLAQHSSPQQNVLASLTKTGTPLQSANSTPLPGESEKVSMGIPSLLGAGNVGHQHTNAVSASAQSLPIDTPGISASPLLPEINSLDGTHANAVERLINAVRTVSAKALSSSISDMSSVISMMDRIGVGEDLVAMTKRRMQTQDGPTGTKRMKCCYTTSNVLSSSGSVNDSFALWNGSDLESIATSSIKRLKIKANHALIEEIREINRRLIDTVLEISNEGVDASGGTTVKCCFSAVSLSPNLKSQYASAQIQPLRLLVPANYPNCSPIIMDKFPVEVSKEYEDLSIKARSKFSASLPSLSQPMSLRDIARTWDFCARAVILEYDEQSGGGSFSSKYGTWEDCMTAA